MNEWFQQQIVGPIRETAKKLGITRSTSWYKTRKAFIEKNPVCAICGTKNALNVHHIEPVHLAPEREHDETNLITLCRKHHFTFGHLGWWCSWNNEIIEDAEHWDYKYKNRPRK